MQKATNKIRLLK